MTPPRAAAHSRTSPEPHLQNDAVDSKSTTSAKPQSNANTDKLCQSIADNHVTIYKSEFLENNVKGMLHSIVEENLVPIIEEEQGFPREGQAWTDTIKYITPYIRENAQAKAPVALSDLSQETEHAYLKEAATETIVVIDAIGADGQVTAEERQQLRRMVAPHLKIEVKDSLLESHQAAYDHCVATAATLESQPPPPVPSTEDTAAPASLDLSIPSVLGIDRALETTAKESASLPAFSIRRIQKFI